MPRKSKTAQRKASSIAIARSFRHSSDFPDAEMITTPPETSSASPNAEIIIDLDNEDINEGMDLEGHSPESPLALGLEEYAEFEDDEQGYVREGEELEEVWLAPVYLAP